MTIDASEWGTPKPGRKSEKRQRSAVVNVRMTQAELAYVQAEARARRLTVGTYMREVAMGCHSDWGPPSSPRRSQEQLNRDRGYRTTEQLLERETK